MSKGKGISFYWAIGVWGGCRIDYSNMGLRLVLGNIAFKLCFYDVDYIIGEMARRIEISKETQNHV